MKDVGLFQTLHGLVIGSSIQLLVMASDEARNPGH
ncbi:hypothetical protein QFZ38_002734 [Pseudomonas cedrina]|nr:hypothetical protein [Pseudomonas cedrina]